MLTTLANNSRRQVALAASASSASSSSWIRSTTALTACRSVSSTTANPSAELKKAPSTSRKSLVTKEEGVHQTMHISKNWRNKPLFRRQGDVRFKTGLEAAQLLVGEAMRRDSHEPEFIDSVTTTLEKLSPIFDRNPKYAFVAKQLIEPERLIQFRVAWIDDVGVVRMNRGFRIQYSSSIGPYEGALHFGSHINSGVIKALGFDAVFSNALTGFDLGAAVGGSDFNPSNKSEAEMQRFCQSYMTELAKYIGPDIDIPWMGMGVGEHEMGYLFGQYKRIKSTHSYSSGSTFMTGSKQDCRAPGFGVVHFANEMLKDKGDTLEGKRCLIIGSGKVARNAAEKLLAFGAIPLTFSDESGHVYEPDGISEGRLKAIAQIKQERGALLGRYIISSTTAQFNNPENILDIPCDICFPCGAMNDITEDSVNRLADNGCQAVIEGGRSCVTPAARKVLKKRGLLYGPHTLTLTGPAIVHALGRSGVRRAPPVASENENAYVDEEDEMLAAEVSRIYQDVTRTASEFNARGDLLAGANIIGFLRVANVMLTHGAV